MYSNITVLIPLKSTKNSMTWIDLDKQLNPTTLFEVKPPNHSSFHCSPWTLARCMWKGAAVAFGHADSQGDL